MNDQLEDLADRVEQASKRHRQATADVTSCGCGPICRRCRTALCRATWELRAALRRLDACLERHDLDRRHLRTG